MDKLKFARTLSAGQVIIGSGDSVTTEYFDCGGMQLRGVLLPENWNSCNISFNVSSVPESDTKFKSYKLTDATGTEVSIPSDAEQWIAILPYLTDAVPYLQIECDGAQADDVVIQLILEPIYQGIHN